MGTALVAEPRWSRKFPRRFLGNPGSAGGMGALKGVDTLGFFLEGVVILPASTAWRTPVFSGVVCCLCRALVMLGIPVHSRKT